MAIDAEKLYKQGREIYDSGNFKEALPLIERAAEGGNLEAQLFCACMYYNREGVSEAEASKPKNQTKMLKWFETAAENGTPVAQFICGYLYGQGIGADRSPWKAFQWIEEAAKNGYVQAYPVCGYMYRTGEGPSVNNREAVKWYEKAIEAGEYGGATIRASIQGWQDAKELANGDIDAALDYYGPDGLDLAMSEGKEHFLAGKYDRAFQLLSYVAQDDWWRAKALLGSKFLLGRMYAEGLGVAKDPVKAKKYFDRLYGGTIKDRCAIPLGAYPQGPNGEVRPIEWFVLERKGDSLLLFSREALEVKPYHNTLTKIQWADCDLRKWLNGEFLNSAFSDEEKRMIQLTQLDNSRNRKYHTVGGANTEDRVFLLSVPEAVHYLCCEGAKLEKTSGGDRAYFSDDRNVGTCLSASRLNLKTFALCWLRTSGKTEKQAAYLFTNIYPEGEDVTKKNCVRPALWINLAAIGK
ncbi:MAG: sel1 repeat family protein [Firmicutes bacterium]|nr:sel1 repeat family protein [Bacillota bacterium]